MSSALNKSNDPREQLLGRLKIACVSSRDFEKAKEEKKGLQLIRTPFIDIPAGGVLLEECFDGENVFYTGWAEEQTYATKPDHSIIKDGDAWYAPVDDVLLRKGQVLLPSRAEEYENDLALFNEVKIFLDTYHDQPNEAERAIDALYIFLTHISDLLPVVPYRRSLGNYGRGKTRYLRAMAALCYRSVNISGASTLASLRRYLNTWRGSLMIDEANFYKTDLHADLVKMINLGHSQEDGWLTLCDQDNEPILLNVYGPKILASREELHDEAAESRFLTFNAKKAARKMPIYLSKKFKEQSLHIRNKLLLWRFRNYEKIRERVDQLEDLTLHDLFEAGIDQRVKQIVTPLFLIADESLKPILQDVVTRLHEGLEDRDETAALVTAITEALFGKPPRKPGEPGIPGLVSQVSVVSQGGSTSIKLLDITKAILGDAAEDVRERRRMGRRIANIVRHELEWRVTRGTANYAFVEIPAAALQRLNTLTTLTQERQLGCCELCGRDDRLGAFTDVEGEQRFICFLCRSAEERSR